jgi:hypothetical protein
MKCPISLAPAFRPVSEIRGGENRLCGFPFPRARVTGLKPGANEKARFMAAEQQDRVVFTTEVGFSPIQVLASLMTVRSCLGSA